MVLVPVGQGMHLPILSPWRASNCKVILGDVKGPRNLMLVQSSHCLYMLQILVIGPALGRGTGPFEEVPPFLKGGSNSQ